MRKTEVRGYLMADNCELSYSWDQPDNMKLFTFRLHGKSLGKPFNIYMRREAVILLMKKMLEGL